MIVRAPNAMIMTTLNIWICTIFEAIANLGEDLDLAKLNWDEFINKEEGSASLIFLFLARVGYVFCAAIFLFRIWTFWYRSELNKVAQIYGEAAVKGNHDNWRPSLYVRMGNTLKLGKKVRFLCLTWMFFIIFPSFMIEFILDIDQETHQLLLVVIYMTGTIPMFVLMVILVRRVKNNYGVV